MLFNSTLHTFEWALPGQPEYQRNLEMIDSKVFPGSLSFCPWKLGTVCFFYCIYIFSTFSSLVLYIWRCREDIIPLSSITKFLLTVSFLYPFLSSLLAPQWVCLSFMVLARRLSVSVNNCNVSTPSLDHFVNLSSSSSSRTLLHINLAASPKASPKRIQDEWLY